MSIDERIMEFSRQKPSLPLPEPIRREFPDYQVGEKVPVRIVRIEEYGAFALILDGKGYQGLIHKSNISKEFVVHPEDYVQLGEEMDAWISKIQPDGKIQLTLIEMEPEVEKKKPVIQPLDNELRKIISYIEDVVGIVSEESRNRLIELYKQKGPVQLTIHMMEALQEFQPDLSLVLVKEIERKAREGL